jgi:hypothetical protein
MIHRLRITRPVTAGKAVSASPLEKALHPLHRYIWGGETAEGCHIVPLWADGVAAGQGRVADENGKTV